MLHLSTECSVKRSNPQRDVVAIRKIACIQDNRLVTDVCSTSSGMDAINCYGVIRGALVATVPLLVQYRVSFSTVVMMQSSLAGVRSPQVTRIKMCRRRCNSRLTQTLLQSLKHISIRVTLTKVT